MPVQAWCKSSRTVMTLEGGGAFQRENYDDLVFHLVELGRITAVMHESSFASKKGGP